MSLRLLASKDGRRRLPAVEILRVTRTIRECIRSGRLSDIPELIRKGRDLYSMQLFDQHLIDLVNAGAGLDGDRDLRELEPRRVRARAARRVAHLPLGWRDFRRRVVSIGETSTTMYPASPSV